MPGRDWEGGRSLRLAFWARRLHAAGRLGGKEWGPGLTTSQTFGVRLGRGWGPALLWSETWRQGDPVLGGAGPPNSDGAHGLDAARAVAGGIPPRKAADNDALCFVTLREEQKGSIYLVHLKSFRRVSCDISSQAGTCTVLKPGSMTPKKKKNPQKFCW